MSAARGGSFTPARRTRPLLFDRSDSMGWPIKTRGLRLALSRDIDPLDLLERYYEHALRDGPEAAIARGELIALDSYSGDR